MHIPPAKPLILEKIGENDSIEADSAARRLANSDRLAI